MHSEKQTVIFVFIATVAFVGGDSFFADGPKYSDTYFRKKSGGDDYVADINEFFDDMLPSIQGFMILNGMDPMGMPDFNVSLKIALASGTIYLENGWLQNLSKIRRSDTTIVQYSHRLLTMNINIGWDHLDFNFKYLLKMTLIQRSGLAEGLWKDLHINLIIQMDTTNYEIHLQRIEVTNEGKFLMKLTGNVGDTLLNTAIKLIVPRFKQQILDSVLVEATRTIDELLNRINTWVKPKIKYGLTFFRMYSKIANKKRVQ